MGWAAALGQRLWPYRLLLFLATVLLLAGILGAAADYGKAQTAIDAEMFSEIVRPGEVRDYRLAAYIDLLFAAGYGLLALTMRSSLDNTDPKRNERVAAFGCGLVVVGAALDEVENGILLWNLHNRDDVSELAIDAMTAVGKAKWVAVIGGLALLLLCLLIRWLWPTFCRATLRTWVREAFRPYLSYLALILLLVIATLAHLRLVAAILLLPLLPCAFWLNRTVSTSRMTHPACSDSDQGPARLLLTFAQVAVGVGLVLLGLRTAEDPLTAPVADPGARIVLRDVAFVFGVAFAIMSLGSLISELRQNQRFEGRRGPVLFVAAVVLVAGGALVGAGTTMLVLFGVGVLLGEVAVEVSAEDYRRSDTKARPFVERFLVLVAVEVVGLVALIGMGVDPAHALGVVVALTIVVAMALADGDALFVVCAVALLIFVVTTPYELDVEDSLDPVANEPYVLVLGDSYTSGEGAQEYLPGTNEIVPGPADELSVNECRQAPTAWAFELALRAAAQGDVGDGSTPFPTRVLFIGCSGAVSENIHTEPRTGRDDEIHGPAELAIYLERKEELRLDMPALVIVGIGGNDGGFGDLGEACVGPGNCAEVAQQFLENRPERLIDPPPEGQSEAVVDISDDLEAAYTRIRDVVGDAPVVATAYPEPVAIDGRRCAGALLEAEERAFINGFARQLNAIVSEAAEEAGFSFMDISDALANSGSQLCADSPTPGGLNFIAFGSKGGTLRDSLNPMSWFHNSLHPSVTGHSLFADDALVWFDEHWPLDEPVVDEVDAPPIADFLDTLGVDQCDPLEDRSCSVEHNTWLTGQATQLYRTTIVPLGALVFGLYGALRPIVAARRARGAAAPINPTVEEAVP